MKQLVFALLLLLPASPRAETEEPLLEPVVVEETRLEAPLEYPSSFSTVIESDKFGGEYNSTSELLSFSPGVVIRDFGGFGQLKTISIRGSSNDQVVILLDGIRINTPLGGVDLSTIPPDYIERIEIIRGGASALAGSDAIGGVVNIVTRKTEKPFTNAYLTYGSFDTLNLNLSRAQKIGKIGYLLSFTHARSDGDFKFKSVNNLTLRRINNEFSSNSFLGKIDYEISGWKLDFLNEFFFDDKGVPGLGEFQEDSSNQKDLRNVTSIKISKNGLFSRNLDFNLVLFSTFDQVEFKDPQPTLGIPIDTLSRTLTFGANPRLKLYAPFNQILTLAAELRGDILRNLDFNNPERFTASAYISDEISLAEDKILLLPILRFDFFKTFADKSSTEAEFSPKLGIIFSPLKNLSFKGNIGKSFRAPNFNELFFPEQGFIGGNPELSPERSFDFDFGLVFSHPNLLFEISYFRQKIDNLILFVFISAQRIEPRNVGKVTQQGIEASLIFKPFHFLELFAGYTFLDGELKDTGAQLPGRPRNKFNFRGVLKHRYLSLFWETHFVDKIPLTAFPGSSTTKERTTHDVGVKAEWRKLFFTLESKNVFNNLEVRDAFDFPLPGRTIFFTAGLKF
ncbi:Vitamin B12 transporter BtuB [bacterium HR37]|nr:Vitamin B12 transporter BtuB [bacterium HR37]